MLYIIFYLLYSMVNHTHRVLPVSLVSIPLDGVNISSNGSQDHRFLHFAPFESISSSSAHMWHFSTPPLYLQPAHQSFHTMPAKNGN